MSLSPSSISLQDGIWCVGENVNHLTALGKRGHAGLVLILGYALVNQPRKFGCHLLVVIEKIF